VTDIPLPRAVLVVWPVPETDPRHPRIRCLIHDGPLPRARADKLRAACGFERPFIAGERITEVFEMFATSPGWADPAEALREFGRIDPDPELRAEMAAGIARRQALVKDAADWREATRLLHAAGECGPAVLAAVDG
jgi:hypothetical protein